MLDEYKKAVIASYRKMKEEGKLSLNLMQPTASKLKQECITVLKSRTKKEDEKIIKEFFNSGIESNDYGTIIKKFDRDRLKPLDNFLEGGTVVRDYKNVELLAWLIGYEPRPYNPKIDYTSIQADTANPLDITDINDNREKGPDTTLLLQKQLVSRNIIVSTTILILLIAGICIYRGYWTTAYICDHGSGRKYHLSEKCPALKNCKNGIIRTTVQEAEKNGKILCDWENK